jgi:glycosidase
MFATMLYCLRGIPFIYQGQEIGVTNSYFNKIEDFDDMETTAFHRAYKDLLGEDELWQLINFGSRDNARHPMPWNGGTCGGFNEGAKTWLPLYPKYKEINVEADKSSEKSVFRYYKELLALRRESEVLRRGSFEDITGEAKTHFLYRREHGGEEIVVLCNFEKEAEISLPAGCVRLLGNYPAHESKIFAPFEAAIYKVIKN